MSDLDRTFSAAPVPASPHGLWIQPPSVLQNVVQALPTPAVLLDGDGAILARNAAWGDLLVPELSAPDEELRSVPENSDEDALLPGTPFLSSIAAANREVWRQRLDHTHRQRTALEGTADRLRILGYAPRWVDWTLRLWSAPAPEGTVSEPSGWVLIATDRTDAVRADQMRKDLEQRFDVLLDTIQEGTLLMDRHGTFHDCNEAAARMLGRSVASIIGSRFTDDQWRGLREDGTPMLNSEFPFWQSYVERAPVEGEVMGMYLPDEPPRWLRVSARPLYQNGEDPYAVLACLEDITEEQLKDEALQASRDLLSSVLSTSLDGILVFTAERNDTGDITDFRCQLANPQAEKMLAATVRNGLVGSNLSDIGLPDGDALHEAYAEVLETGAPFEDERHYATDALSGWFQVVCVRLEEGCAVTLRDITDRKEAAQAMATTNAKLEQRNRALRDFAYVASHDLQEPLRKITAFSNLVLEDYGDKVDDMGHHYLTRMQDAARRMSQLINDLLIYSRVTTQARPFEPVDLHALAETICADLDLQIDDVGGTVHIDALPTIEADPTQMRQLLQNLIGNALKFHRADVPPVVDVKGTLESAAPHVARGTVAPESTAVCRFVVSDNGIGFEQKYEDRIFTPFKRLHGRSEFSGTGMGLAICRRIVERHGGTIAVESTPNEGTTFTVWLPASRSDDASAADSFPTDHGPTE